MSNIIIFESDNPTVDVRLASETACLSLQPLADLFARDNPLSPVT